MNRDTLSRTWMKRLLVAACVVVCVTLPASARALTVAQFTAVRETLSNEVATLGAIANPTPKDLKRLRTLVRASAILTNTSNDDGRALRSLMATLPAKKFPDYAPLFQVVATNLLTSYNKNFQFVSDLLPELPPSPDTTLAQKQLKALTPIAAKLNAHASAPRVASLLDPARRRLNQLLDTIARALIPVFPGDLSQNTIAARVNGINMRVGRDHASDNVFAVTATETNISIYCSAVDATMSGATSGRGLILSVPNVIAGTVRYQIPSQAAVTYRAGVYGDAESIFTATNGAAFISTQGAEIFGVFSASGPDLTITGGRFRLSLPTSAAASE